MAANTPEETKEKIRELLIEGGMSMRQIAAKVGVTQGTVARIRNKINQEGAGPGKTVKRKGNLKTPYDQSRYHMSRY